MTRARIDGLLGPVKRGLVLSIKPGWWVAFRPGEPAFEKFYTWQEAMAYALGEDKNDGNQ